MNIDSFSGRELDAAVARHVFGFEVEERENAKNRQKEFLRRDHGETWLRVAFYSTSLSASLNVNEKLARLGWKVREQSSNRRPDPAGLYHLDLVGPGDQQVSATGTSWELALCRAALKAVVDG